MTPSEFLAARHRLGLTQTEMAKALRLTSPDGRAVRNYESGDRDISGPVSLCIDYMLKYGPLPD